MREKTHLEKLALEWGSTTEDSQNETDVLENLEPHTNLKHLEIKNYGGTRFPTWLGDQSLCNMVSLRLENCRSCVSLPPLGQMPSLKELTIARMPEITNLGHEFYKESGSLSIPFESLETLCFEEMMGWVHWVQLDAGEFSKLEKLEIIKCPKLIGELPRKVPALVNLEIKGCPELVASLPRTTSISELVLEECQGIQLEWQGVSFVEQLKMSGFESLVEFASELVTLTSLKFLVVSKCSILSLPETGFPLKLMSLYVEDCGAMQCFPGGMMCLMNLKHLRIERCPELVLPLPEETSHCNMSLESLTMYGCDSLKSLPLGLFPKLRHLTIQRCINFETLLIPDGIENQNLTLLEHLAISNCNNMVSFPCRGIPAPQLSNLWISNCEKLKALPEQMHTLLPSLQSLELWDCPEIESLPEGGLPSKLCHLVIAYCEKLVGDRRNWGLQRLPSLRELFLSHEAVESFPEEGLLPSTLTSLSVRRMQNLKALNGRGLQLLVSLKIMEISYCPQLKSLPEEGLPASLIALRISDCPLLTPRCRREGGEDWHKVAHVPLIAMDDEAIFEQVYLGTVSSWEFYALSDI